MTKTYQEIWKKRAIIYNFAITSLKVKYRSSILGFFWTFLEPLLMLSVLYIVFTNIFKSEIEHFALYLLLGIILWNMFSRGTTDGLTSILSRSSILTQFYLPKEIPPLSSAITSFLMLCFDLMVFGIFMAVLQFLPPPTIVFLPLILLLEFFLVFSISLPLSVANVRYRDIQFIWTVVIQAGFFLTPIFYKSSMLPDSIQNILQFSPMVQILNIARDLTLYNKMPSIESIQIAIATTLIIFIVSYAIFKKSQIRIIEEL